MFLTRPTVAASIVWSSHPGIFNDMDRPWSLSPTVMRAKVKVSHSAVIRPGPRLASVGVSWNIAYPSVSSGEGKNWYTKVNDYQQTAVKMVDLSCIKCWGPRGQIMTQVRRSPRSMVFLRNIRTIVSRAGAGLKVVDAGLMMLLIANSSLSFHNNDLQTTTKNWITIQASRSELENDDNEKQVIL